MCPCGKADEVFMSHSLFFIVVLNAKLCSNKFKLLYVKFLLYQMLSKILYTINVPEIAFNIFYTEKKNSMLFPVCTSIYHDYINSHRDSMIF